MDRIKEVRNSRSRVSIHADRWRRGGCLQRLAALRVESDAAVERAEVAEKKNKELEQLLLANEQEIRSLSHRNGLLEAELEKNESKISEFKSEKIAGENSSVTLEGLSRKVQILEGDLENTERRLQESASK